MYAWAESGRVWVGVIEVVSHSAAQYRKEVELLKRLFIILFFLKRAYNELDVGLKGSLVDTIASLFEIYLRSFMFLLRLG